MNIVVEPASKQPYEQYFSLVSFQRLRGETYILSLDRWAGPLAQLTIFLNDI